jgi:hypothetical protein
MIPTFRRTAAGVAEEPTMIPRFPITSPTKTSPTMGTRTKCSGDGLTDSDSATSFIIIANANTLDNASFVIPHEPGKQMQVIIEVCDEGTPPLTGYQRVIYNIQ